MFANLLNLSLLALALPITTLANNYHGNPILNRNPHHRSVARRADGDIDLFKRASGARWSFYNVETGNALVPSVTRFFVFSSMLALYTEDLVDSSTRTVILYVSKTFSVPSPTNYQ